MVHGLYYSYTMDPVLAHGQLNEIRHQLGNVNKVWDEMKCGRDFQQLRWIQMVEFKSLSQLKYCKLLDDSIFLLDDSIILPDSLMLQELYFRFNSIKIWWKWVQDEPDFDIYRIMVREEPGKIWNFEMVQFCIVKCLSLSEEMIACMGVDLIVQVLVDRLIPKVVEKELEVWLQWINVVKRKTSSSECVSYGVKCVLQELNLMLEGDINEKRVIALVKVLNVLVKLNRSKAVAYTMVLLESWKFGSCKEMMEYVGTMEEVVRKDWSLLMLKFGHSSGETKEKWLERDFLPKLAYVQVMMKVSLMKVKLTPNVVGNMLALTLPLVDDNRVENQIHGLQVLGVLLNGISMTHLDLYIDMVQHCVMGLMFTDEETVLRLLLKTILLIIQLYHKQSKRRDALVHLFLPRMVRNCSHSTKPMLQTLYLDCLSDIMQIVGLPTSTIVMQYTGSLLDALQGVAHKFNVRLLRACLQCTEKLVNTCWLIISKHNDTILAIVFRVMAYFLLEGKESTTFKTKAIQIISTLYAIDLQFNLKNAESSTLLLLQKAQSNAPLLSSFLEQVISNLNKESSLSHFHLVDQRTP